MSDAEYEFQEWYESIRFVDGEGKLKPDVLKKDTSSDPDDDRAEDDETHS